MTNHLIITPIGPADAETLLNFSRETFFAAFAQLNNPADMEAYALIAFRIEKLQVELENPHSYFYFAYLDGQLAGYLKLNLGNAQTEFQEANAMEVERIYVDRNFQNRQIGKQLLAFAVNKAKHNQLQYIWLGVWDANQHAIRFYRQHGFEVFSSHPFLLGNDKQTDLLMRKFL